MRTVRAPFGCNAEFCEGRIDAVCQFRELRCCVNPDPEYSRRLGGREKSISRSTNFERGAIDPLQAFRDGGNLFRSLFSDELQRDVQRLRTHPSSVGREPLHAFDKAFKPCSQCGIEIDADEYSHHL